MEKASANFCYYLSHHSKIKSKSNPKLAVVYEKPYQRIINSVINTIPNVFQKPAVIYPIKLNSKNSQEIIDLSKKMDLTLFFIDYFMCRPFLDLYPKHLNPLLDLFKSDNSFMMSDFKNDFNNVFHTAPKRVITLNKALINLAKKTKIIRIKSKLGSELTVDLHPNQQWTNIDGITCNHIVPSEIATESESINGRLIFTGSFLSTIPLALKHGIIKTPVEFIIKNSRIVSFTSKNKELVHDIEHFFSEHSEHNHIDELGIGTNENIQLVGGNCYFEEGHAGLHLGLSGKAAGSHHLDLIQEESIIYFDNTLIFDGKFHV